MNTRLLAASVLRRVIGNGHSLTDALDDTLPQIPKDVDRAFVQALCFGVVRWYFKLNFILQQLANKPIQDEEIRLLALLGLYQLEYTRVKPHAAVAETVAAADAKAWAKPLINALLRRYQRERDRLIAQADIDERALWSHPSWLLGKIRRQWPEQWEAVLTQANRQAPMSLRVNLRQISREDYRLRLRHSGLESSPCRFAASGLVLETPVPVSKLPGFAEGMVSVQDESAQLAVGLLQLQAGQRVLDLCAAPGGKTLHILESEPGLAEAVAVDIDSARLDKIQDSLTREGFAAQLVCADAQDTAVWWDGRPFDRILLDAPCSATGVIRRHPDIKLLRKSGDVANLVALQGQLLASAWSLLAEGGLLVYATCSLFKEENEEQIAQFVAAHPEARELPIHAEWGSPRRHGRQILPGESGMDGFFYACLSK